MAGQTLSEYVAKQLNVIADRPTFDEVMASVDGHGRVDHGMDVAELIRLEREGR